MPETIYEIDILNYELCNYVTFLIALIIVPGARATKDFSSMCFSAKLKVLERAILVELFIYHKGQNSWKFTDKYQILNVYLIEHFQETAWYCSMFWLKCCFCFVAIIKLNYDILLRFFYTYKVLYIILTRGWWLLQKVTLIPVDTCLAILLDSLY